MKLILRIKSQNKLMKVNVYRDTETILKKTNSEQRYCRNTLRRNEFILPYGVHDMLLMFTILIRLYSAQINFNIRHIRFQ